MTLPILDLENEANWRERWFASFSAEPVPDRADFTYPIAPAVAPFTLESPIIAIAVTCPNDTKRRLAGWVNRRVRTGVRPAALSNAVRLENRRLFRNETNLIVFPKIGVDEYAIEVAFGWWIRQAAIQLYEYVGIDSDTVTEQLNRIEQSIDRLTL